MNDMPIEELYFEWLYSQIGAVKSPDPSAKYDRLMGLLYTKEFIWIVLNDDNRAEDGRALRVEFIAQRHYQVIPQWFEFPCSILELLIALSRRLAFEGEGEPRSWFWILIENLGLGQHRDGRRYSEDGVHEILEDLIWRTYDPSGRGGLFPLRYPKEDQREVEIWYQMSAYLLEAE